jgi:hypothetical protein
MGAYFTFKVLYGSTNTEANVDNVWLRTQFNVNQDTVAGYGRVRRRETESDVMVRSQGRLDPGERKEAVIL